MVGGYGKEKHRLKMGWGRSKKNEIGTKRA
jgi:hypothetical protein